MVKRAAVILVGFLSVAAVIGFAVTRTGVDETRQPSVATGVPGVGAVAERSAAGNEVAADAVLAPQAIAESAVGELPGLPPLGQAVVKTAELTVEVAKGTFADAFDEAALVASRYGGYVESSSMSGAKSKTGSLTVRVPSDRFDEAMSELRGLGTIKHEAVAGQVVTQQFIDLEARLRTWETQEAVLLGLMEDATTVDATLRIQRELQGVQFRIEQIEGQLRVLEDQTTLAAIHVSMREPGAPVVVAPSGEPRPSLAEAWERAVDGVLQVAYVTIVGLGYLVPLTLLGLLVWFLVRRIARTAVPPAAA